MEQIILWESSGWGRKSYYLLVLIAFIYLIYRYRKQKFSILIILLFFNGLFAFFGKSVQNGYRISLVILTIYWILRTNFFKKFNIGSIVIAFLFFSLTFLYTSYINGDYFSIIFSQYSRYFILFSLFFILKEYWLSDSFKVWIEKLIYEILIVQVILTILKFIILGTTENIVGSVASQGGAIATTLPILGFAFLWTKKRGKFEIRDWVIILGLVFIGFVSLKRAIWFIMPIVIVLFMFYIPRIKIPPKVILYTLLAVPLVFYLGIRYSPSLNKEGRVGGSFDINYAFNYAQTYMFGEKEDNQLGQGRGGATLLVFNKLINGNLSEKDLFGYGLRYMYTTDYEQFDELGLGISSKAAATGIFQTLVAGGYIGIFATLWFLLSLLFQTRNKRFRYVLIGIFCWEYIFYTGMIIRDLSLSFLLIYLVLFTFNSDIRGKKYFNHVNET